MNESESIPTSPPNFKGSDYLANIIKSIGAGGLDSSPTLDGAQASAPQNDLFSSLLSSPELISKLPTIISTVKPLLEMLSASSGQSAPKNQVVPTAAGGNDRGGNAHRTALLCALKPYLSADRRQAIDYIIKLDRLGDVLKTL